MTLVLASPVAVTDPEEAVAPTADVTTWICPYSIYRANRSVEIVACNSGYRAANRCSAS